MSWCSPRCNVGAGPAQIPRHPRAPGEGGRMSGGPWPSLEAWPMPKEGDHGGLGTSLGPGWEGKVGPTPSCGVWSRALSSQGPEGAPHRKAGPGRSAVVAWDAQRWTPLGLAQSSVPASSWGPGHREQTHLSSGQEWLPPPQLSEFLLTATTLDLLSRPPACK